MPYKAVGISAANADGTNVTRLTQNTVDDLDPVWSPDSVRIAFDSNRDGNFELYSMRFDGTDILRLTFDSAHSDTVGTTSARVAREHLARERLHLAREHLAREHLARTRAAGE